MPCVRQSFLVLLFSTVLSLAVESANAAEAEVQRGKYLVSIIPCTDCHTPGTFLVRADMVSLGSGFRGGLFFASLLLGALGGQLFAVGLNAVWPGLHGCQTA